MVWEKNMIALGNHWMKRYDDASKDEGWALFDHDGTLQIQKVDDPEPGQGTLLGDDSEAYRLVCEKALQGSVMHVLALYLDGRSAEKVEVPNILIERFIQV